MIYLIAYLAIGAVFVALPRSIIIALCGDES